MRRGAIFSDCKQYRYVLRRTWQRRLPTVLFVALNPSTADDQSDDPTIRRCSGFARDWGFGGVVVANLFAFRSTDPALLAGVPDPVGPDNDRWLTTLSKKATLTIAAWGIHGTLRQRGQQVLAKLKDAHHLGQTRDGHPRHPLYLRRSVRPVRL